MLPGSVATEEPLPPKCRREVSLKVGDHWSNTIQWLEVPLCGLWGAPTAVRGVWRCFTRTSGARCVMTAGGCWRALWCAGSWAVAQCRLPPGGRILGLAPALSGWMMWAAVGRRCPCGSAGHGPGGAPTASTRRTPASSAQVPHRFPPPPRRTTYFPRTTSPSQTYPPPRTTSPAELPPPPAKLSSIGRSGAQGKQRFKKAPPPVLTQRRLRLRSGSWAVGPHSLRVFSGTHRRNAAKDPECCRVSAKKRCCFLFKVLLLLTGGAAAPPAPTLAMLLPKLPTSQSYLAL
uniref:Uncharacterized protein n=1 Tax=Chelydra serpentina TaxID=8475 RepID=A0A8C3S9E6_CHESE